MSALICGDGGAAFAERKWTPASTLSWEGFTPVAANNTERSESFVQLCDDSSSHSRCLRYHADDTSTRHDAPDTAACRDEAQADAAVNANTQAARRITVWRALR